MDQWLTFLIIGGSIFPISLAAFIWCQKIILHRYWEKEDRNVTYIDPATNTDDRFNIDDPGRIKVFGLPSEGSKGNIAFNQQRQLLEVMKSFFLILSIVSVHFIVLAGFLADRIKETTLGTLGFAFVFSIYLIYFPLVQLPPTDVIKANCFYEHVHETFIVTFFVFVGQGALMAFLVSFVIESPNSVYTFKEKLDTTNVWHLLIAISVDYVRYIEFKDGFGPSSLTSVIQAHSSTGKIILRKDGSEYHYFVQPSKLDIRIRTFMRFIGELVIPLFIFIIAPVLLTFTESPIDVLLNILGLTLIGLIDNSFGTAVYQVIDKNPFPEKQSFPED